MAYTARAGETTESVTVIGDVDGALVCEVGGRRIVIPRALMLAGSEVSKPGDHGNIVVPSRLAFDLGLSRSQSRAVASARRRTPARRAPAARR